MSKRCVEILNQTLHEIMTADKRVVVMGEDILDPYGGAFKVTKGLSTAFPERVFTTPVSEAGIVGCAGGLALSGFRPIVEIMFGDFIALTIDQLLNHLSKYRAMYNDKTYCPVVLRTPMGARRGYGPTHSQSLEKLLIGIPGLDVVTPSVVHPIDRMLKFAALNSKNPTVFLENKRMYGESWTPIESGRVGHFFATTADDETQYPTVILTPVEKRRSDIVLLTYGDNVSFALQVAEELFLEEEIVVEVVALGAINPLPRRTIAERVRNCGRCVTLEEGTYTHGIGAEIVALLSEDLEPSQWQAPPRRIASHDGIIPASKERENSFLPSVESIRQVVMQVMEAE